MNIKVIAQLFSLIALLIGLSSFWRKKREHILMQQAVSGILMALQFLMLGSLTACLTALISCIRSMVFSKKNKVAIINTPITLVIFTIAYIIIAIITWKGVLTVIPIAGSIYYMMASWNNDENVVRSGTLVASSLWIIYDITCMAYVACINELVSIISAGLAILNSKKKLKENIEVV